MNEYRWSEIDRRVVEIRIPLEKNQLRRGSGIVISPGRILTALHVIVGGDAARRGDPIVAPPEIKFRVKADFDKQFAGIRDTVENERFATYTRLGGDTFGWRPATLRWPRPGEMPRAFELALLEIEPKDFPASLKEILPLNAWIPRDDSQCRLGGYPTWAATELSKKVFPDFVPVYGRWNIVDGGFTPVRWFTVTGGAPQERETWSGLSGAAIFHESIERLVAIVSTSKEGYGNNQLGIIALRDIADKREYDEFWVNAGITNPSRSDERDRQNAPLKYIHLFDRADERDVITETTDAWDDELLKYPVVVSLLGEQSDEAEVLIKRFNVDAFGIEGEGPEVSRWVKPNLKESAKKTFGALLSKFSDRKKIGENEVEGKLVSVRKKLVGKSAILNLHVKEVSEKSLDWFASLLKLWAMLGKHTRPPVLYIYIWSEDAEVASAEVVKQRLTYAAQILEHALQRCSQELTVFKPFLLNLCEFADVPEWLDDVQECEPKFSLSRREDCYRHLQLQIGQSADFRFRRLRQALKVAGYTSA